MTNSFKEMLVYLLKICPVELKLFKTKLLGKDVNESTTTNDTTL